MLVTLKGVRVYDITQSITKPILIFNALETYLKDAVVYQEISDKGKQYNLNLS